MEQKYSVIWGYDADARLIYDRLERKPDYFVADTKDCPEMVYCGCKVRRTDDFWQDAKKYYIYISSMEQYETLRALFAGRGLLEGVDFSGAFEYLSLQNRFVSGIYKEQKWNTSSCLYTIWNDRVRQMSQYIGGEDQSVLDLGCGSGYLKEILSDRDIVYLGCDYIERQYVEYICDFNRYEFPDVEVDVAFISGCMEYVDDSAWFMQKVCQCSDTFILSYRSLECLPNIEKRRNLGIRNDYSICQIIQLADQNQFQLSGIERSYTRDNIFVCKRAKERITNGKIAGISERQGSGKGGDESRRAKGGL